MMTCLSVYPFLYTLSYNDNLLLMLTWIDNLNIVLYCVCKSGTMLKEKKKWRHHQIKKKRKYRINMNKNWTRCTKAKKNTALLKLIKDSLNKNCIQFKRSGVCCVSSPYFIIPFYMSFLFTGSVWKLNWILDELIEKKKKIVTRLWDWFFKKKITAKEFRMAKILLHTYTEYLLSVNLVPEIPYQNKCTIFSRLLCVMYKFLIHKKTLEKFTLYFGN